MAGRKENVEQEIDQEIDQATSKQATKAKFSSFPTCWKHSRNNFEHVEEEQVKKYKLKL